MQMIFSLMANQLLNLKPVTELDKFRQDFKILSKGFFSIPLKIPGTSFHKSLQVMINTRCVLFDYIFRVDIVVFM
jgi:hypothetical protein